MTSAVYALPMTTRFRGITRREGVLVRGAEGWGEFSPFWDYDAAACRPWLAAAREAAERPWPRPVRDAVPVNVTVPAVDPPAASATVRGSGGCTTAKVKVAEPGQSEAEDLARLAAVREALGPAGRIRVDANAAWDLDTAARLLPRYDEAAGGLEYAEQPCRTLDELAALRRRVAVPLAADESLRGSGHPFADDLAEAVDVVVLKWQPLGGFRACLEFAERCGKPVVVSSALETSVGLAAGVALAAALPDLPFACGLATGHLLSADVVRDRLLPVDGMIPVRRPEPDPELLAAAAADADTARRWTDRMAEVAVAG